MPCHDGSVEGGRLLWFCSWSCGWNCRCCSGLHSNRTFQAHRVGFAFHPRHVLPLGRASKSLWCHCCVHFLGIPIAELCGKCIVTNMSSVGFEPVGEEWQSCYFHPALKLYLVVYVDDFTMAGPKEKLVSGWSLIRKGLDIEPPVPIGVYLGCTHGEGTMKIGDIVARTMTYNMEDFLSSGVDRYLELAGNGVKLKTVATPFPNEDQGTSSQGAPCESGTFCECPWCEYTPFLPMFISRRMTPVGT